MRNSDRWGFGLMFVGVLIIIVGFLGRTSSVDQIDKQYQQTSSSSTYAERTWTCGDQDPIEVGRKLRDQLNPNAYAEDRGNAYLRKGDSMYVVTGPPCRIELEKKSGRYSSGGFVYLGPGFSPSSPSGGSGGSAGSSGGTK